MNPEVIGEGTYGCVTKPSIHCKNKSIAYDNKVSKIMLRDDALKEYEEMKELSKNKSIHKYIIPHPEICKPLINEVFHDTVKKCENEDFPETKEEDFLILVLDDGGVSLKTLTDIFFDSFTDHEVHVFLSKIHHLMKGLLYFNKKGIVHHDIAGRNVVYNVKTGVIRFIDFGLLNHANAIIQESKQSKNKLAKYWKNFPPENGIANYHKYKRSGFEMDYDLFLKRMVYTFDWFSLGDMMKSISRQLYMKTKISTAVFEELYLFFSMLGERDIQRRDYNIHDMTRLYKDLLVKHSIWTDQRPNSSSKSIQIQESLKNEKSIFPKTSSSLSVLKALGKRRSVHPTKRGDNIRRCKKNYRRNKITQKCVRNL
jgi:serine/threonine protein kinase